MIKLLCRGERKKRIGGLFRAYIQNRPVFGKHRPIITSNIYRLEKTRVFYAPHVRVVKKLVEVETSLIKLGKCSLYMINSLPVFHAQTYRFSAIRKKTRYIISLLYLLKKKKK